MQTKQLHILKQAFLLSVLFMLIPGILFSQLQDTLLTSGDSMAIKPALPEKPIHELESLLKDNFLLNTQSVPVPDLQQSRKPVSKDALFYFLAAVLLFLGILRASFDRYFGNLLRVFFNTSLRQSQLTDQLLQARLPSLFFNIFFVVISGLFVFLLLNYFGKATYDQWNILFWCILSVLLIYLVKFAVLIFTGWLTGYTGEAETYVFIVFLINKIIALLLVPLVVIIAFSGKQITHVTVTVSYILIGLMLLLRFFRSYGLLQHKMKVSRLHFMLYIIGIELLPILLIYKGALVIMSKNL